EAAPVPGGQDAGNWLYAVALRVARQARARAERRRHLEGQAVPEPAAPTDDRPDEEARGIVAEEVGRLPDKYRRPVVLCCLQGKSYAEAAQALGWPEGTVSGRLARARGFLGGRLRPRGPGPPARGGGGPAAAHAGA